VTSLGTGKSLAQYTGTGSKFETNKRNYTKNNKTNCKKRANKIPKTTLTSRPVPITTATGNTLCPNKK